jgi:hypothetical protein
MAKVPTSTALRAGRLGKNARPEAPGFARRLKVKSGGHECLPHTMRCAILYGRSAA